jgi:hypothetical protein
MDLKENAVTTRAAQIFRELKGVVKRTGSVDVTSYLKDFTENFGKNRIGAAWDRVHELMEEDRTLRAVGGTAKGERMIWETTLPTQSA